MPTGAESTEVLDRMAAFQSPDEIPALVVFERDGGVTRDDSVTVASMAEEMSTLEDVSRQPLGPFPSEDREAL